MSAEPEPDFAALLAEAIRAQLAADEAYKTWFSALPVRDGGHDNRAYARFQQALGMARFPEGDDDGR